MKARHQGAPPSRRQSRATGSAASGAMGAMTLKRSRYHGTDIDGVILDEDRLEVGGLDVRTLIASWSLRDVWALLFLGAEHGDQAAAALCDAACRAGGADQNDLERAYRVIRAARSEGATPCQALMAGLCVPLRLDSATEGLPAPVRKALSLLGCGASLAAEAIEPGRAEALADRSGTFVSTLPWLLCSRARPDPGEVFALERVMVAWAGGFGWLPPSVMIPRLAAGTQIDMQTALAGGFAAAGPAHIGAVGDALRLLGDLAEVSEPEREGRAADVLDALMAHQERLPGFGHPLLNEDPRPAAIGQALREHGHAGPGTRSAELVAGRVHDRLGLLPNIDFATAAVLVDLGVRDPGAAPVIAMYARAAGMLAHIIEKAALPPFGMRKDQARYFLRALAIGWI